MKVLFRSMLAVMVVISLLSGGIFTKNVYAEETASGTCGDNVTWALDSTGVLTISGTGEMTRFTSVSSVPWNDYKSSIVNINLSENVTMISNYAFYGCENLQSVPDLSHVKSIGAYAFYKCSNLTSINIPANITNIGSCAFRDCTSLNSITVNSNNTAYSSSDGILYDKNKTELIQCPPTKSGSYSLPTGVTKISLYAFALCSKLTAINFVNTLTTIEEGAFYGCSRLSSIKIPKTVTSIQRFTFYGCSRIKEVTLPSTLTTIGNFAFYYCGGIESITIPASVKTIGNSAFENCSGIRTINISDGVTSLGDNCFRNCTNLPPFSLPETIVSIGNYAFNNCLSLGSVEIPSNVESIGIGAYSCCNLNSVRILSKTASLGENVFSTNIYLSTVLIPDNVTYIETTSFFGCDRLSVVYGVKGSYAEEFAEDNGYTFIEISKEYQNHKTNRIQYSINNSLLELPVQIKFKDIPLKLSETIPEDSTCVFAGWDTNKEAKTPLYKAGDTYTENSDVTLYAVWARNITLTYNANGGSNAPSALTVIEYSKSDNYTFTVTDSKPKRRGYKFEGWSTSPDATTATYQAGDSYSVKEDATLYAVWSESDDIVYLDDCEVSLENANYVYDGTYKKPAVSVKNGATALQENVDYSVAYSKNLDAGTGIVKVTGMGDCEGVITLTFTIDKATPTITAENLTYKKTYGAATFKLNAKTNSDEVLTYKSSNTSLATVSSTGQVTLKKKYGKVTITITSPEGINYKKATQKISIEVVPKKMKLKSLKSTKKKYVTVKWAKDTTASYYEMQYAANAKFTKAKKVKSPNSKVKGYSLKYKSKKTVYIRVRAVSTKNGTHYGAWSASKHIKVK